jgi:hypothetical protein
MRDGKCERTDIQAVLQQADDREADELTEILVEDTMHRFKNARDRHIPTTRK